MQFKGRANVQVISPRHILIHQSDVGVGITGSEAAPGNQRRSIAAHKGKIGGTAGYAVDQQGSIDQLPTRIGELTAFDISIHVGAVQALLYVLLPPNPLYFRDFAA